MFGARGNSLNKKKQGLASITRSEGKGSLKRSKELNAAFCYYMKFGNSQRLMYLHKFSSTKHIIQSTFDVRVCMRVCLLLCRVFSTQQLSHNGRQ